MKKDAFALRVEHVQPYVNIQDRINEASLHLKNIFQDIRKEGKIQLEKIVWIKAKVAPVIAEAAMNPDIYSLFDEPHADHEYTYRHNRHLSRDEAWIIQGKPFSPDFGSHAA
ncbi:hypothetical protein [Peribacillus sp. AS_2]|uniref:hypothetical protein n=1 Tax=Peribacillus sp. AS_2 TaxID=2996755 RepID=UPI0022A70A29|nr:hypothetical protein [Peribacillus sp. AS_2]MCZ0871500.1 hypothetical protein [Peribacillus sp. AS_2]